MRLVRSAWRFYLADMISRKVVSIVGAGGLGQPCAYALNESWQEDFRLEVQLIDSDAVELSNLNRQVLTTERDLSNAKAKAVAGAAVLSSNERVVFRPQVAAVTEATVSELLSGSDFVVDATDNPETKLLTEAFCRNYAIPFCYSGVIADQGVLLSIIPSKTAPRLSDIFGEFTEENFDSLRGACRTGGIFAPIAGLFGMLQAREVIRWFKGELNECTFIRFSLSDAKFYERTIS